MPEFTTTLQKPTTLERAKKPQKIEKQARPLADVGSVSPAVA